MQFGASIVIQILFVPELCCILMCVHCFPRWFCVDVTMPVNGIRSDITDGLQVVVTPHYT